MCGFYKFFETLGTGWINIATVLGAAIGVGLSVFAIWFSKKLGDESTVITTAIRENTAAIQKQTDAVHRHTKVLRLDNLRYLYEISREKEFHPYWHFRWRFETYDSVSVTVQERNGEERVNLGACNLLIRGFSNAADHIGFEGRESEFYTANISNVTLSDGQQFPFVENELVGCFEQDGELMISKGIAPWTREPSYLFLIVGIGNQQLRRGERNADNARTFPRIKDS
jgi:hypothetical protein